MPRALISACLLGRAVRYDGGHKRLADPRIARWHRAGLLVPLCPEIAGGLPTPRPPAELTGPGAEALDGRAQVRDAAGADVTAAFLAGAEAAVALARAHRITLALLIDGSPSCGATTIYDGSFTGRRIPGQGVTAAALSRAGVAVYTPAEIDDLATLLDG